MDLTSSYMLKDQVSVLEAKDRQCHMQNGARTNRLAKPQEDYNNLVIFSIILKPTACFKCIFSNKLSDQYSIITLRYIPLCFYQYY